jgi:hypothetical protein
VKCVVYPLILSTIIISCVKNKFSEINSCKKYALNIPKFENNNNGLQKFYLFIDGTPSMKGFVSVSYNNYKLFLENLENIVSLIYKRSDVEYYRFGKQVYKINRNEFKKSSLEISFYNDPITYIDVVIDSAIKWSFENKHYLILTDLFQQEGDIDKFISKIKELASLDIFMGIVSIDADFKGKVYDVSPSAYSFNYEGKRPFYLLIFSKNLNVIDKIIDEISNQIKENVNALIIGNYLSMSDYIPKISRGYEGLLRISDSVMKMNKSELKIPLKMEFDISKYSLLPNFAKVKIIDCEKGKVLLDKSFSIENNILNINFKITKKDKPHIINVNVYSNEIPNWVKEKDMDITKINIWLKNPKEFEGSKTYNLYKFINSAIKVYDNEIGRFNIYLLGG